MSPQTEAALIAGVISLIGMLVSAFIAFRTMRVSRTQTVLVEWLKEQREAVSRIRSYAAEVEELRSRCWVVAVSLDLFLKTKQDRNGVLFLRNANLGDAFSKYWDKWSQVKPDIVEGWRLDLLRMARHETKTKGIIAHEKLHVFVKLLEAQPDSPELIDRAEQLRADLHELITDLDKLYRLVCDERDLVVVGLTSPELPYKKVDAQL